MSAHEASAHGTSAHEVLAARLESLRGRVADLVERRAADDPTAADPLRGMYVTPETALRLATAPPPQAAPAPASDAASDTKAAEDGSPDPLEELARRFGLSALDRHVLLAALAPDVDRRFEPLYGYLNDDVGRRRATVTLALDLSGTGPHDPLARRRFHPLAPLRAGGLIVVEDEDRPLPGRALRVPERVVAQLLGDDALDPELVDCDVELLDAGNAGNAGNTAPAHPLAARIAALAAERPLRVHLRERREGTAAGPVADALRAAGRPVLWHRPTGTAGDGAAATAVALLREARLRRAALVVGPLPAAPGPLMRSLTAGDVPVVFFGSEPYDPGWAPDAGLLALDAPQDGIDAPRTWQTELARHTPAHEPDFDLGEAVAPYRLSGTQIRRAARDAAELAAFDGTAPTVAHLQRSARLQSAPLLDKHARRIRPEVGFADLVLPDEPLGLLNELTLRARHRDKVLGEWRLRTGGGRGRGVIALFAGDSGTGKTLSAEVVAGELGLDLYVVDLSAVVDKYIGETEKNLERIFVEADRTDAVLLFDEADAVFGKRSEVKSSHDRYANLESAYLLQRLEAFDGIAVLTTNLRANIDDAFTRRLDLVVDFPFPDVEQRLALWRTCLTGTPCAPDLDAELTACAKEFELSGGAIRSAAVTAAYQAAGHGGPVSGADVRAGARREYRKMGRLEPGTHLPWQ
ncbi:ATP-binding protein [Streptomyces atriruber]|uniref:ATP-binding protein n=1 Tax=Streptomyces atriruber TaxID=545121 RepID=UPI0006E1C45D|nr:ATP-binding protein [Streptomyces atriruber]